MCFNSHSKKLIQEAFDYREVKTNNNFHKKGNNAVVAMARVRAPGQTLKQNMKKKIFLRRFPLSRFLTKTLSVNKNCHEKFFKNLSFGVEFKL